MRFATDRLRTAAAAGVAGALLAVLIGAPTVALFVVPWVVLLILGFHHHGRVDASAAVGLDVERVVVGDLVDVTTTVVASQAVTAKVTTLANDAFFVMPDEHADSDHASDRRPPRPTVDVVRAGGSTQYSSTYMATEWGTHDMGRVVVELTQPFGLFGSRFSPPARRPLRVHPTSVELRQLLSPWFVRRVSGTHRSPESARGIEYADIREFAEGDSVRDINWRVTARTGDLWVSQRHPDRATDVVLLVDSFVETGHDVRAVFGLVATSALALAESHLAATDRVGLIEFGGVVHWVSPTTGRVQLQRLTDALLSTGLYSNAADKELPELSSRILPARSFVIAFTPLFDDRFIDAVFTARARGHDVAVIECAPPSSPLEPTETATIMGVTKRIYQAERTLLRDRMAAQGIGVVQWDGHTPLDVEIGQLVRRRRAFAQQAAR